eukprot:TRINITY_DN3085_c0_g3_i2.p1 TRINITY_DN3085_c0_g3~~TRINITY_DN3085_c0_g3_i2.p1  ORF type:complete len:307 (+),score=81.89 TRINITY_DN3085_c0_g3_i2:118-1038(+)
MEEKYTMEDMEGLYDACLRFPAESFYSPEFWKGLILCGAVAPRLKALGSDRVSSLWRQVMSRTNYKIHVFKSMMADYMYVKGKNEALSEKVENGLVGLLLKVEETESKMSAKRQTAEGATNIELSTSKILKVETKKRFRQLDLTLLVDKNAESKGLSLTERYDKADEEELTYIAKFKEKSKGFIEAYSDVSKSHEEHLSDKYKEIKMSAVADYLNDKVKVVRRALKMFQECYGKSSREISEICVASSGNLELMRRYLRGEAGATLWEDEDDYIIKKGAGTREYEALIRKRGKEEVERRTKYLEAIE